jgi:hypothetical protein
VPHRGACSLHSARSNLISTSLPAECGYALWCYPQRVAEPQHRCSLILEQGITMKTLAKSMLGYESAILMAKLLAIAQVGSPHHITSYLLILILRLRVSHASMNLVVFLRITRVSLLAAALMDVNISYSCSVQSCPDVYDYASNSYGVQVMRQ